jgi:acyl-CoA reductase-like NAD-dependent aldehyde dehydrogenase
MYGLAAAVFSRDISRALRIANRVQAGTVWSAFYSFPSFSPQPLSADPPSSFVSS